MFVFELDAKKDLTRLPRTLAIKVVDINHEATYDMSYVKERIDAYPNRDGSEKTVI